MTKIEIFCIKSKDCKYTDCPRHLNGFDGLYVQKADFDCRTEYVFRIKDEKNGNA